MSDTRTTLNASVSKLRQIGMLRRRSSDIAARGWSGNVDRILDGKIEGWVKCDKHDLPLRVDVVLDDRPLATDLVADLHRQDVEEAGVGTGRFGFSCPVPSDGALGGSRLTIRSASSQQILLTRVVTSEMIQGKRPEVDLPAATPAPICKPKKAPVAFEGRLEILTDGFLQGWACDKLRPGRIFDIDILIDGVFLTRLRNDRARGDLARLGKSEGQGGFQLSLFLAEMEPGSRDVTAVLPDGQLLTGTVTTCGNKRRYLLNVGLARIEPADTAVIVPIYNAADDLETCIQRLADYTPSDLDVLLIDDASPDRRISALLDHAEAVHGFRVLRNASNVGFTRTINRGLQEIGQKHAILLNSDARVTPGWAQGMLRAASSRPRVATVTAMSDRAGAFSAPRIGNDNPLPDGVDEITYSRAFRRRSLGLYPVVLTANGFCMFVHRDCIAEIGTLDAEAFPRGYGEENDFCMRAGRAGWSHLIDDRTYVFHDRSKSFGEAKTELMAAGRRVVDERYPEYNLAIRTFNTGAELAMARYRAAQALADCSRPEAGLPVILYVVATQSGGTPQTNMDLMKETSDELAPWLLHCDSRTLALSRLDGCEMAEIRSHQLSEPVDPVTHRSGEYDAVLRDWLEIANPRIVHIQHLAWHSLSLPGLAKSRGSRVVFSFHDFYTLCPTVKLLDENNLFCGGTCTKTRGECSIELWDPMRMPRVKDSWVHVWRKRFSDVLRECDAYVTMSDSARERILSHLELDRGRFFVIPHGRSFTKMEQLREHPRHGDPVKILVPGNINAAKGGDVIKASLEHDRAGLLEFHILGRVSNPENFAQHERLVMHGAYRREEFSARVAQVRPHLGAMLSIWDETYCHTLTELWSVGVPAVVFNFPTVAGRMRASGAGWVVPHQDITKFYEQLVDISFSSEEQMRADSAVLRWQAGNGVGRSTKVMSGAYREVYRKVLGRQGFRPTIAVACPAAPDQNRANASTEICVWERTADGVERKCVFVRMTPHGLLANLRDGIVDGVIVQRNAVPSTMVKPFLDEMQKSGVRYVMDLDDDLFAVPTDKDPGGSYAAYVPALEMLVGSAAAVTTSTETLQSKIAAHKSRTVLLPNRLSERLWRGKMPDREKDGTVRALYMGSPTHKEDFEMIAPALAAVAEADPHFRVAIIGVHGGDLPAWADRIVVPDRAKSYAHFAPWLKEMSATFDFGLAPLTDDPFNLFKSNFKMMDYGALGLPVLASDMPVFRAPTVKLPGLRLVKSNPDAWRRAVTDVVAEIRAGLIDRAAIRSAMLAGHGLACTLNEFDDLLVSLSRSADRALMVGPHAHLSVAPELREVTA